MLKLYKLIVYEWTTINNIQEENTISLTTHKRALALDALRGLAILAMVLSGTIRYKILPVWMYHAQEPPPTHDFNGNIAGLTWVDLVFPIFLFTMGAAIPLALSRRVNKGFSQAKTIFYIFKRGFLLGIFAILLQHFRPHIINPNDADTGKWWLALLGFVLLFLMFVRWPNLSKISKYKLWIKTAAWIGAIAMALLIKYPNNAGFSLERSDSILVVLTNMAIFGSLIWLFTSYNLLFRLGLLVLFFAMRLSSTTVEGAWTGLFWSYSPIPWIFQWDYLKYLFIVIPGTIAGDLIINWMEKSLANTQEDDYEYENVKWENWQLYTIILLMISICLVLLIGLQSRWVWQTTIAIFALCSYGWFLFYEPNTHTEYLLKYFYQLGVYWLILGLFFEPFGGGIKKDPATMSYFFVTTGIAFFILIIFTIIVDIFNRHKWLQLLIDNGQNPMIAYVGFANIIWPILNLTGLEKWILDNTNDPFLGFIKGVISTLIIAYIVSFFTKLKLFWKT